MIKISIFEGIFAFVLANASRAVSWNCIWEMEGKYPIDVSALCIEDAFMNSEHGEGRQKAGFFFSVVELKYIYTT